MGCTLLTEQGWATDYLQYHMGSKMSGRQQRTVSLNFDVSEPKTMGLRRGDADLPDHSWLAFAIKPPTGFREQSIWLLSDVPEDAKEGTGTGFKSGTRWKRRLTANTPGTLYLRNANSAAADANGSNVAWCHEFSHPEHYQEESYSIEIFLPEQEFADVRNLFAIGKPPSIVSVLTSDIDYGNAPDGSDRDWDIGATPHLKVSGYSIGMSVEPSRVLVGPAQTDIEVEHAAERSEEVRLAILHSREDIQLLCLTLANTNTQIAKLRWQFNVLIVVAAASLTAAILSHLHP